MSPVNNVCLQKKKKKKADNRSTPSYNIINAVKPLTVINHIQK